MSPVQRIIPRLKKMPTKEPRSLPNFFINRSFIIFGPCELLHISTIMYPIIAILKGIQMVMLNKETAKAIQAMATPLRTNLMSLHFM